MKKLFVILSVLVVLSMALTACGPKATEVPSLTEAPTEAPIEVPATEAPTEAPAPTDAPTDAPSSYLVDRQVGDCELVFPKQVGEKCGITFGNKRLGTIEKESEMHWLGIPFAPVAKRWKVTTTEGNISFNPLNRGIGIQALDFFSR